MPDGEDEAADPEAEQHRLADEQPAQDLPGAILTCQGRQPAQPAAQQIGGGGQAGRRQQEEGRAEDDRAEAAHDHAATRGAHARPERAQLRPPPERRHEPDQRDGVGVRSGDQQQPEHNRCRHQPRRLRRGHLLVGLSDGRPLRGDLLRVQIDAGHQGQRERRHEAFAQPEPSGEDRQRQDRPYCGGRQRAAARQPITQRVEEERSQSAEQRRPPTRQHLVGAERHEQRPLQAEQQRADAGQVVGPTCRGGQRGQRLHRLGGNQGRPAEANQPEGQRHQGNGAVGHSLHGEPTGQAFSPDDLATCNFALHRRTHSETCRSPQRHQVTKYTKQTHLFVPLRVLESLW